MHVTSILRISLVVIGFGVPLGSVDALAQRGAKVPPEHANQKPINHLPNPYETVRDFGTLPDGRTWGSVSAMTSRWRTMCRLC